MSYGTSHHRTDTTPQVTPWLKHGWQVVAYQHRARVEAAHPLMFDMFGVLGDDEAPCFADPTDWVAPDSREAVERATDACLDCPALFRCLAYARVTKATAVV